VLVSRAFAVRDRLKQCPLRQRLLRVGGIPSLPVLYQRVMVEIQSTDSCAASVAHIIEQDPGMSARLLQIVNSAGVGLAHRVSNITQAVSLLGLDRMRTLVLAAELYSMLDNRKLPRGFSADALWQHSLAVATYAKAIALGEGVEEDIVDDAFMAGLLHDIGLVVLATSLPDELAQVLALAKEKRLSLFEAERKLFQATHAEIGGYLLELWGLPDPVVVAISFHDFPSAVPEEHYPSAYPAHGFTALTAVHVANYFHEDEQREAQGHPPVEADVEHLNSLGFTEKLGAWWDCCQETVRTHGG
jgi:HD-like signal output (HDOD) protein